MRTSINLENPMKKIANVLLATTLSASMALAVDFDSDATANNELLVNKSGTVVTGTPLDAIIIVLIVAKLMFGERVGF